MATWTWAAASRRGTSHERTDTKRQDAFRCVLSSDRQTFIALACDGAGSASHGGEGAIIASRALSQSAKAFVSAVGEMPTNDLLWEWIDQARDRIAAASTRLGLTPRDFATTVVMVISTGEATLTVHIGDGAAIGRSATSAVWESLSWPEHGEYASTTFFLTDDGEVRVRISRCDTPIDRLAIFTDGIERLALDFAAGEPHSPFFTAISEPIARSAVAGCDRPLSIKLGEYLASDAINQRTDDDKTLVLASLR